MIKWILACSLVVSVAMADDESIDCWPDWPDGEITATYISHSYAMTAIHNEYRSRAGLQLQYVDENLTAVAQRWAEHMASRGSMFHGGGEQIIAYSGGDRSYNAGYRLWIGSPPHRAWLCSSGNRCGFGYAVGRNGCAYYAGAFAGNSGSGGGGRSRWFGGGRRLFRRG